MKIESQISCSQHRTQIFVRSVDQEQQIVGLWIAGRSWDETVYVPFSTIPAHVLDVMIPEKILHAKANMGVKNAKDIVFSDWELS